MIPTYIIHGTSDEVAPFGNAERFMAEMQEKGIQCEFLALKGVGHIHDVGMRPGMAGWEEGVTPGYAFLFGIVQQKSH
jgi:acetyl esterase/lipase